MRVVLDTNVLIAAFIARGVCSVILEHCVRHHTLVTSDFILDEFHEHMIHKFRYSTEEVEEASRLLRSKMEVVTPVNLGSTICRDPDDDAVLGTAIAGNAICIVTGDNDLLTVKQFYNVTIIRPAEFAEYEASRSGEST